MTEMLTDTPGKAMAWFMAVWLAAWLVAVAWAWAIRNKPSPGRDPGDDTHLIAAPPLSAKALHAAAKMALAFPERMEMGCRHRTNGGKAKLWIVNASGDLMLELVPPGQDAPVTVAWSEAEMVAYMHGYGWPAIREDAVEEILGEAT